MPRRLTKFVMQHREEIQKLRQSVVEFTFYFDYEKAHRHVKFEARVYLTMRQIHVLGGLENIYRHLEYLLYDTLDIYTFEWDSGVIGYRHVDKKPTRYGSWIVHQVYGGSGKWEGSMKYAYGRRVRNVYD
jgi:hypothetical protein